MPLAVLTLAALAAACNSGPAPTPSAPTTVTSPTDASTGDAARTATIEVHGTVARVSGRCPALRFLVGRVIVETNRSTTFAPGTCADVVNGAGVVAKGSRQSDGTLAASSVAVRASGRTR